MDLDEFITDVWGLRTHPFLPKIDARGKPMNPGAIEPALNPLSDDRVLNYYFDFYDWGASPMIRCVHRETGFETFPGPGDLPGDSSLMLLITGRAHSGRESLANLIVHKIARETGATPLVTTAKLSHDADANARSVAARVVSAYRLDREMTPAKDETLTLLAELNAALQAAPVTVGNVANVFMDFRDTLRGATTRPVVLNITEGGGYDAWARLYEAVHDLFSFVIVTTGDDAQAGTCYTIMRNRSFNVALIKAELLDLNWVLRYVTDRLAGERVDGNAPANPYAPFTPSALQLLFQPGPTARGAVAPPQSIGWVRQRLRRAFDDRARSAAQSYVLGGPVPDIDAAAMRSACDALNRGQGV